MDLELSDDESSVALAFAQVFARESREFATIGKIRGANLEEKIDGMTAWLPAGIVRNLHAFGFIGNVAAHRLKLRRKKLDAGHCCQLIWMSEQARICRGVTARRGYIQPILK